MRIEATRQIVQGRPDKTPSDESRQGPVNHDDRSGSKHSRALVLTEAQPAPKRASGYRQAAFLAQLIATREQAPQTRERRRASPAEAIAAYRAMAALADA